MGLLSFLKKKIEEDDDIRKNIEEISMEKSNAIKIDTSNLNNDEAMALLAETLENSNIKTVMIGAFAMSAYNYSRETFDIDFLVDDEDLEIIENELEKIGYEKILKTPQYAKFRNNGNTAFFDVDVVFVARETIDKIVEESEMKNYDGVDFVTASFNTVVATKLHAVKHNNERRDGKDILDIIELLNANDIDPDGEWFKKMCGKYSGIETHRLFLDIIEGINKGGKCEEKLKSGNYESRTSSCRNSI